MKYISRVIALSITLAVAAPTHAAPANPTSVVTQVTGFISQIKGWLKSIQTLQQLPGQLFNGIDYKDLALRLGDKMASSGLKMAGIDLNSILGPIMNNGAAFQKKIEDMRADITKQSQNFLNLAWADDYGGTKNAGLTALNPELQQLKINSAVSMVKTNNMLSNNVKDTATASQVVEDSKTVVTDAGKHAIDENQNAQDLINQTDSIQSTREGIQLLVRAQAESVMNQAYSTTALTNAISQQVRQTQVSNNMLSDLVQDVVAKRKDIAQSAINTARMQQATANSIADNTQDSINTVADGIDQAVKVDTNDINMAAFY